MLLVCCTHSWAQVETRSEEAEKRHTEMIEAMDKGDYQKAIKAGEQELQLLRQQDTPTDTLQAELMPIIGKCYNKIANPDKAIELNKEAIAQFLKNHDENSSTIAIMYDNIAYYLCGKKQYREASEYSKKAVAIYYKLMTNDSDMASTLMHAAECANYVDENEDAVLYQKHACRIYATCYGEHSNIYLGELDYLVKYLKAAGKTEDAEETTALKERLEHEQKYGYIPMAADLSTAEKCQEHNEDAYYASIYFQHHYVTADSMLFICKYLFNYMVNSGDVHSFSGTAESKWMSDQNAVVWMTAYFSGFITYQLVNDEESISLESYKAAYRALLNCYQANKKYTGEVAALEEYVKLNEKDPKKLIKKIEKNYEEYRKAENKGKVKTGEGTTVDY